MAGQEFGRASGIFLLKKENVCKSDDPKVNRRGYWENRLLTGLMTGVTRVTRVTGMTRVTE